jgi:uncharacterized lipoprotein YmbA
MKPKCLLLITGAAVLTLAGCSSVPAQYTYIMDAEMAAQADNLTRTQTHTGHVVWVNPPMRRIEAAPQQ